MKRDFRLIVMAGLLAVIPWVGVLLMAAGVEF